MGSPYHAHHEAGVLAALCARLVMAKFSGKTDGMTLAFYSKRKGNRQHLRDSAYLVYHWVQY